MRLWIHHGRLSRGEEKATTGLTQWMSSSWDPEAVHGVLSLQRLVCLVLIVPRHPDWLDCQPRGPWPSVGCLRLSRLISILGDTWGDEGIWGSLKQVCSMYPMSLGKEEVVSSFVHSSIGLSYRGAETSIHIEVQ